jgi:ParB-like chromosome segregation protein Spo0J
MRDMEMKTVALAEIKPYDRNPRKNEAAVEAVAESIRQCGYVAPIIVDEKMTILAGHVQGAKNINSGKKTCAHNLEAE